MRLAKSNSRENRRTNRPNLRLVKIGLRVRLRSLIRATVGILVFNTLKFSDLVWANFLISAQNREKIRKVVRNQLRYPYSIDKRFIRKGAAWMSNGAGSGPTGPFFGECAMCNTIETPF